MSKCKLCRKECNGTLCINHETDFNNFIKQIVNVNINYKIGDTLFTVKSINTNGRKNYTIVPIIYKGPITFAIKKWKFGYSNDWFINFFNRKNFSFLQCNEIDKKSVIYRNPTDLYKTLVDCQESNKKLFTDRIIDLKKDAILQLVKKQLDELLKSNEAEILNNEQNIVNYLITPSINEITFREEQYKQIRNEIKNEILQNETDAIRNEIILQIYSDIKSNLEKSKKQFLNNQLEKISNEYKKSITKALDDYLNYISI